MGSVRAIDETHPAFCEFLEHIARGASLQDIYSEAREGFAIRPEVGGAEARSNASVLAQARDEFARMFDHDRDLVAPLAAHFQIAGKRILSFGCGTGALSVALALRGADVVGVDPTGASLRAAQCRARYFDSEHVYFAPVQIGTAPGLPFRPASFDLVISNSVLEFIPDRRAAYVRDLVSLLKPGGLLVISTQNGLFPRDYYTGQWLPLLRRRTARRRSSPYGLTWFELRRWTRDCPRPVRDLSPLNAFNSLDKLIDRWRTAERPRAARTLELLNRLYKKICRTIGLPSDLLFPYTTFVFQVHPPLALPGKLRQREPGRRQRAA